MVWRADLNDAMEPENQKEQGGCFSVMVLDGRKHLKRGGGGGGGGGGRRG